MCGRFWYSWRAQIEDLQTDYEVAAIDLPGFNASDKPSRVKDYLTQNVCRIIAAALDGLSRESCIVVGACPHTVLPTDMRQPVHSRYILHLPLLPMLKHAQNPRGDDPVQTEPPKET